MSNVQCLIVDDEAIAQRIIASYLNDLKGYDIVATCKNAMEAMDVLSHNKVDLMFLDIEMPKIKGLDFLKTLKEPPAVIITTAHRNYALESYDYEILDYLLKPISFERFLKAVNRFKKIHEETDSLESSDSTQLNELIYVKSDRKTVKLKKKNILYVEGMNNYVIIHLDDRKHIVYTSISDLLNELGDSFKRIHKSFVVNKIKVDSFSKDELSIGSKALPIGKTYKEVVNDL